MQAGPTYRDGDILFCKSCGERNVMRPNLRCSKCGYDLSRFSTDYVPGPPAEISPKSFGLAACLCGIFGVLGVHHFYLGNIPHGMVDLGLFVGAMVCLYGMPGMALFGVALLFIDILHSIFVMYLLFTGQTKDSAGRIVAYPGQFR